MRVIVPYVTLHPLALRGLQRFAPEAELIDLGVGRDRYHQLLAELWKAGEGFLIVEQDVELNHDTVLSQMEECPEPWCVFPYPGPKPPRGWSQESPSDELGHLLYRSLGCTRFSGPLLTSMPRFMTELPHREWHRLDREINLRLSAKRFMGQKLKPHVHWPYVLQHHVWDGECSCGEDHDPFPVDTYGRFVSS